jgi:polyisoprenyl-phosphate glycosyltransferase
LLSIVDEILEVASRNYNVTMCSDKSRYNLDVIVPCYQEEEVLPVSVPQILAYFRELVAKNTNGLGSFRILLVDDGSKDRTWAIILHLATLNPEIRGIRLARNYGHQAALLSGLSHARADVTISMDADLQDDILAVDAMLQAYEDGAHLALGVRTDRASDSISKRESANAYYRVLSLLGVRIIENHADFRLMSKAALDALLEHQEVNLFLRGLIPTLGFPTVFVPYARKPREQGKTKYTLVKMLRLAIDGITSFSIVPLRAIAVLGAAVFVMSIALGCYFILERIIWPDDVVPGWASTIVPVLLLGGLQILSIGVIGEYIGKIYTEVKRRPRFIVQEKTNDAQAQN